MILRFGTLALLAVLALAAACSGSVNDDPGATAGCEPVTCDLFCENGFATGPDGCGVCSCKAPAGGCQPVACNLFCENGFAKGRDGCEVCDCAPSACEGPNPQGCNATGCPPDSICDTSQRCVPSSCSCAAERGSWVCTDDCGGGVCVPVSACRGPDPSGCASKGCPTGQVCNDQLGCFPSGCECDPSSGGWGCTADCGGGVCVPDPSGCSEPDPTGCMQTGCPLDQICMATSGVCVPSWCECDAQTGTWSCTDDCGGGKCVNP